jgi:sugar phosphate isomerase/epimerase
MKLGVSMWSFVHPYKEGRLSISQFIHEAKNSGADGVELLDYFYRDVESDRCAALTALEATGLPCPIFSVGNNFAQSDPTKREEALNAIRFGIDEAPKLGAKVVRVFAGDSEPGVDFDDAREWIIEGLTVAAREAAEAGLKLALENHGKLAGRGAQVREIIDEVRFRSDTDAIGANPDTGNFLLVDQESHEQLALVAPVAYMVHFKDFRQAEPEATGTVYESLSGKRYQGTAIGEGDVDLYACLEHLKQAGFEGWLSLEYEGMEDPFTAVPRSLVFARSAIQSVLQG